MAIVDLVLETADAALVGLLCERESDCRSLPAAFDGRVVDQAPPRTEYERWLRERVVCGFCREDYEEREPLWVTINLPGRFAGRKICASCISAVGFTGCEWFVHSRTFASHVINVFGVDVPPEDWEYLSPSWRDVALAFEKGPKTYAPRFRTPAY
jgi:hypothetical protein